MARCGVRRTPSPTCVGLGAEIPGCGTTNCRRPTLFNSRSDRWRASRSASSSKPRFADLGRRGGGLGMSGDIVFLFLLVLQPVKVIDQVFHGYQAGQFEPVLFIRKRERRWWHKFAVLLDEQLDEFIRRLGDCFHVAQFYRVQSQYAIIHYAVVPALPPARSYPPRPHAAPQRPG